MGSSASRPPRPKPQHSPYTPHGGRGFGGCAGVDAVSVAELHQANENFDRLYHRQAGKVVTETVAHHSLHVSKVAA